jgi:hypothetical protein
VDQVAAEVMQALASRGVRSVLLKGASFATWLYGDGALRPYGDVDLLVAPESLAPAEQVLRELGFEAAWDPLHPRRDRAWGGWDHTWMRGHDAVDLHTTLLGVDAHPRKVWGTLSQMTERQAVGGATVEVLNPTARALHVAIHAAHHSKEPHLSRPDEDLARAVEMLEPDVWADAAALAERLQAESALAAGLRLVPRGAAIAERLGLAPARLDDESLGIAPAPLALGFEELAATKGWRPRLALIVREVFPSPAFMRWWFPRAKRGATGLALAYCWRPVFLMIHAIPGFLAWRRRARREAR